MGRTRIDALATLVLERQLRVGRQSYDALAEAIGANKAAVMRWMKKMREARLVHVAEWGPDKNGRLFVPLFSWGVESDAPRPGPSTTPAARMAAHRARQAALAEKLRGES